ncbi:MAG: DUF1294 domain-containing protein [Bacteroidales bacterium]|nr:DUF1294 domain-containing protein [Bacteroidales bacterium]
MNDVNAGVFLSYYIGAINVVTFVVYGLDKWKARRGRWRIPEAALLWLAVLGGSPAALLAMWLFRHKTKHNKFRYGVPVILAVQVALAILLVAKGGI